MLQSADPNVYMEKTQGMTDEYIHKRTKAFHTKYNISNHIYDNSPCWEWLEFKDEDGYGSFRFGKAKARAHRFAYEFIGNNKLDKNLQLDHLCRNRACVNPKHLEQVTCRENLMRGETYAANAVKKTHCKHGHNLSGDNLGIKSNGTRRCKRCAAVRALAYYHRNKSK